MPEIKNQVPTDDELYAYLEECIQPTSVSLLTDCPENRKLYHPEVVEALSYLWQHACCSEFLHTVKDSLFKSLQRLNRLPRTDPFWHNTNFRPTIFKLGEFCRRVLKEEPDDLVSLWTESASCAFYTTDFGNGRWLELYQLNALRLDLVVFVAMFLEIAGADATHDFAEFIRATRNTSAVTPILKDIAQQGGKVLGQWSRSVTALLAADWVAPEP